ncbi:MAPEG family protein [Parasphingorhabdus halotolerans]|uniref:MAPEG family protein n=1 Tax=Parasphingorhabdus halotolerans TaxID=2725558 RepID=A0A6H2DL78_9SPHN|nr:MAPEG family protein [Parasphingorhabdus halotolerans]QJB69419.1 MAPEG family protein [Parasphingorhabdus halotolerans]
MILPITLTIAGAAALINIWLMIRVGQVRTSEKVSVGDGGNDKVIRRMRAHSNFIESAPFVLALIGLIELAMGSPTWLWIVGGIYLLGRVAHGIGMDDGKFGKGRMVGTLVTMLTLLGLGIYAIAIPYFTVADASTAPIPMAEGETL